MLNGAVSSARVVFYRVSVLTGFGVICVRYKRETIEFVTFILQQMFRDKKNLEA